MPGIQDGTGTWATTLANFVDPATGTNHAFDNGRNHDVTIGNGGPGGTVTLGVPITAHSLTFNPTASPYTIAGAAGTALTLATTSPTITTNADVTIAAPIVIPYPTQPPVIFNKNGTGRLTLSGTNNWDGGRTWFNINAGSLWATSPDALPGYTSMYSVRVNDAAGLYVPVGGDSQWTNAALSSLAFRTQIGGSSVFGIDTTCGDFTYSGGLTAARNVKVGPNTLTLTGNGVNNITVTQGTLALNYASDFTTVLTTATVAASATLRINGSGNTALTTVNLASGGTVAANAAARFATINVAPDATFSVAPGVTATLLDTNTGGTAVLAATSPNSTVALTGGGNLNAPGLVTFAPIAGVTYDLTGLSAFMLSNQSVTAINGQNTTVKLPPTATLKTSTLNVGFGTNNPNDVLWPTLALGKTTTLNVGGLQVGVTGDAGNTISASGADGRVMVAPNTSDASVTLRGLTGGASRASVTVGYSASPTKSQTAILDLRGATLDAMVNRLILGWYAPTATASRFAIGRQTAEFAMSGGTFDANEVLVGYHVVSTVGSLRSAGTLDATFTQEGGTARVGKLTLGQQYYSVSPDPTGTVVATYVLGSPASPATLAAGSIVGLYTGRSGTGPAVGTVAIRTLAFNNGRITTLDSATDLTISGVSGTAPTDHRVLNVVLAGEGTNALTAPAGRTINFTDTAPVIGRGGLLIDGAGTVSLNGTNTYTGGTTITAGTLKVSTDARTPLLSGNGVDVRDGRVVFAYAGAMDNPAESIRTLLAASKADNGFANATTLRSSTADATRGLGYADNGTDVAVMATLYGDSDLDGGVSINDFNALAGNFGKSSGQVWAGGDFDYDGGVSINDFNLLAAGFGQSLPAGPAMWGSLLAFAAAHRDLAAFEAVTGVPEPAGLGVFLIGMLILGRRRPIDDHARGE